MTNSSFQICFLVLLCLGVLRPTIYLPEKHAALFIFGDSILDAGNNNYINTTTGYRANFPPYGQAFFPKPTGRGSDGRIIPDFIAEYAGLPFISPYLQVPNDVQILLNGANFASGGAGALVETSQGYVVDLHTQLKYYKDVSKLLKEKEGYAKANTLISTAVHLISIGGNDYLDPLNVFQSFSREEHIEIVIGNITSVIREIYKTGGRKFGFMKLHPIGCIPSVIASNGGNCVEDVNTIAELHNTALAQAIQNLDKELAGFKYSMFDFYTSTGEILKQPTKYGFKDGKTACCGSGAYRGVFSCGDERGIPYELCKNSTQHVFFDSLHPTEAFYGQIASLMWNGSKRITGPATLEALFSH